MIVPLTQPPALLAMCTKEGTATEEAEQKQNLQLTDTLRKNKKNKKNTSTIKTQEIQVRKPVILSR